MGRNWDMEGVHRSAPICERGNPFLQAKKEEKSS